MKYFALFYDVVSDYITRRAQYRDEHLKLARDAHARGELLLGGAMTDPADRTLLIWRAPDPSVVEAFVHKDPYVVNGLVTRWEIRAWNVVIGGDPSDAPPQAAPR